MQRNVKTALHKICIKNGIKSESKGNPAFRQKQKMFLSDAGFFSEIDRKQIQVCAALSIMEEFDVNFLKQENDR